MKETNLNIIKALYSGNHLEKAEIERAKALVFGLNADLKTRVV